ncbi:hypothetical protein ZWY2020_020322 [Hordeum vulgare]|nr:hypothetical protein ZWY2020_020322 [Hordeum vulgare]
MHVMGKAAQPTAHVPDPEPGGHRRVGDRFWSLAEDTSNDDINEYNLAIGAQPAVASPTPFDMICEAFQVGYSEEVVAGLVDAIILEEDLARLGLQETERVEVSWRVVHRKTTPAMIRPWKGPLPKGSPAVGSAWVPISSVGKVSQGSCATDIRTNGHGWAREPPPPLKLILPVIRTDGQHHPTTWDRTTAGTEADRHGVGRGAEANRHGADRGRGQRAWLLFAG